MRHAFLLDGTEHEVWLSHATGQWRLHAGQIAGDGVAASTTGAAGSGGALGTPIALDLAADGNGHLIIAGRRVPVTIAVDGDTVHLHLDGNTWSLTHRHPLQRAEAEAGGGAQDAAHAPMPGTVVSVAASAGAQVRRGDSLLVIESMKLETTISAWRDGMVEEVHVTVGQVFDRGATLVSLAPDRPKT